VTRARLQTAGYEVVTAADGEEVLKRVRSAKDADLILLDIKMPKMDGFQVCKRLKDQPETGVIPIIIFSASESHWKMLSDKCTELGIQDWLQKPFQTHVLLDKVRRALENKKEKIPPIT
jgi:two-component system response regulator MprA